jgi:uncharacterized protein YggU (UPF0235/DUF167 family)
MAEDPWRVVPNGVEVRVRATPRGGRDAVEGCEPLSDGRAVLRIRVRAAPEDGAANDAVRRALAEALGAHAYAVTLAAGATSRVKTLRVEGDPARLVERLAGLRKAAA